MASEGTEATEDGQSTAPVSLLTSLQSLNVRPPSSTPEGPLTWIDKKPSSIGEEGYYRQQDLEALYVKWKIEYDRNKRVQLKKDRLLDVRKNTHKISKRRHKRLHHRAKEKRATRTSDGEDEEYSSGDEQSFSDEDIAGDSGPLTGDSEEDEDGELYDDDSDDDEESSGEKRRRRRSYSGSRENRRHSHDKSSISSSSKKQLQRDQVAKQEEKRHSCPDCGKRFSRPSQLYTHSLTHSGEVNILLRENGSSHHVTFIFLCLPCSMTIRNLTCAPSVPSLSTWRVI